MSSTDLDKKPISIQLKLWRQRMGWTQEKAAEALYLGRRTYEGYEGGRPCKQSVLALALAIEENKKKEQ